MQKREQTSFRALLVVQFFGAFNDNLLKVLVQLLIVAWVLNSGAREQLVILATAVFDAPFIIFSMVAGRLSDRCAKSSVIRWVQVWQLVVVTVAVTSILAKSIPAMMASIFLLSMQAAFFSPAKYGIMPELMGESELSEGNGFLNSATFLAILAGTIAGSFLVGYVAIACGLLVLAAAGGLVGSFFLEPLPAAKPEEPWAWNPLSDLIANWKIIRQDRQLKMGIMAANYFWFVGAVLVTNIFIYAKDMMHVDAKPSGYLLMAVTIGIALGSYLAGRWSRGKVELGLVPLGALGMSVFGIDLYRAWHSFPHALFDFFMLGFCGGLYEIPLNALIQWRSPPGERGRVLATQNFLSFVAILAATGVLWILGTPLGLNPAQIFLVIGVASLTGTVIVYSFLPAIIGRFFLYVSRDLFHRHGIINGERIPVRGPVLLAVHELSLENALRVGVAVPRMVRFLIEKSAYEIRPWHWLLRTMRAIPFSENDLPEALRTARKALEEGDVVCLSIGTSRSLESADEIVRGLTVPVVPVHLEGLQSKEDVSVQNGRSASIVFGEVLQTPVQAGDRLRSFRQSSR